MNGHIDNLWSWIVNSGHTDLLIVTNNWTSILFFPCAFHINISIGLVGNFKNFSINDTVFLKIFFY